VVEGGDNPDLPSKYHPFYITDDPEGGFQHKSQLQKKVHNIALARLVESYANITKTLAHINSANQASIKQYKNTSTYLHAHINVSSVCK